MKILINEIEYDCVNAQISYYADGDYSFNITFLNLDFDEVAEVFSTYENTTIQINQDIYTDWKFASGNKNYNNNGTDIRITFEKITNQHGTKE